MAAFSLDLLPGRRVTPYLAYDRDSGFGSGVSTWVLSGNEYAVPTNYRDHTDNYRGGLRFEFSRLHATLEQGGVIYKNDDSVYDFTTRLGNRTAPSAAATDPWRFVVVRNRGMLLSIADALPYGKMLGLAAVGIVVCGDLEAAHDQQLSYLLQDCSAACENRAGIWRLSRGLQKNPAAAFQMNRERFHWGPYTGTGSAGSSCLKCPPFFRKHKSLRRFLLYLPIWQ